MQLKEVRATDKYVTASITDRGQVTIPSEVRAALGLKNRTKVSFRIAIDGTVTLEPSATDWRASYGAIKPMHRPEDWKKIAEDAREERAERVIEQMKRN